MARTNTDKIDELVRAAVTLDVRLDQVNEQLRKMDELIPLLRAQCEQMGNRLSVIERGVENLKKTGDVWGGRL
ncbi:MAG: hypothetical protein U0871_13085 [Gemmataceae bacterium]